MRTISINVSIPVDVFYEEAQTEVDLANMSYRDADALIIASLLEVIAFGLFIVKPFFALIVFVFL